MKKEEKLKTEFASLCWGISKINNKWDFWWKLLDGNENRDVYKNKMEKLLILLEKNESEVLNMDIETEIWTLI